MTRDLLQELQQKQLKLQELKVLKSQRSLELSNKELHTYSKEIQTVPCDVDTTTDITGKQVMQEVEMQKDRCVSKSIDSYPQTDLLDTADIHTKDIHPTEKDKDNPKEEYNIHEIIKDPNFNDFLNTTSKWMERALYESSHYDVLMDYGASTNSSTSQDSSDKDVLRSCLEFKREKSGSTTDLDFSIHFPELLLASYKQSTSSTNGNGDAGVLVWNQYNPTVPEYTFNASSDVLRASFVKYSPQLILGTTVSGQVLVWDIRCKSDPIIKSGFSTQGHSHPIHSISFVGSHNASNLITASSDGLVCCWQLEMMNQPVESIPLTLQPNSRIDQVAITSLAFPKNESCTFWVGSEQGLVYQANRFDCASRYAGLDSTKVYKGHDAFVSQLDFHPNEMCSEYLLSSSFDWTCKLWKVKNTTELASGNTVIEPLVTFDDMEGYIVDVAWSPTHANLFAALDCTGNMYFYDLNSKLDMPLHVQNVDSDKGIACRFKWDLSGKQMALGSMNGRVRIYQVCKMNEPKQEDANKLNSILSLL